MKSRLTHIVITIHLSADQCECVGFGLNLSLKIINRPIFW